MSARPIKHIACIGEVMIELIASGVSGTDLNVAGDTYNTAVYLARLLAGQGVEVSYVTALGQDSFSERAMAHMTRHGIATRFVERRAERNIGLYAIETDDAGERSFTYWRSHSAARTLFQAPCEVTFDLLEQVDLVFISGITLAILPPATRTRLLQALDGFRAAGGLVAYDSNHRPKLWPDAPTAVEVNNQMWARTDIALPSVDDEMTIHGESDEAAVMARLRGHGFAQGALKRGSKGPLALSGHDYGLRFAPAQKVVDTTAAGDSFNAGYLYQIAVGGSEERALQTGHDIAAQVIGAKGAIVPVSLDG